MAVSETGKGAGSLRGYVSSTGKLHGAADGEGEICAGGLDWNWSLWVVCSGKYADKVGGFFLVLVMANDRVGYCDCTTEGETGLARRTGEASVSSAG